MLKAAKDKIKASLGLTLGDTRKHKKQKALLDKFSFRFIEGADNLSVKDMQRNQLLKKLLKAKK